MLHGITTIFSMATSPKVSVSIITYNHEKYIARTLDSVLQQQVDFPYEIIVGDDCSSDATPEILREYQQRHPDKIQLVLHPKRNVGVPGRLNNITNLYACRGQYIAMLDGDDYWISTNKLQRQADFLDQSSDYAMTFHDTLFVADDPDFESYYQSDTHDILVPNATYTYQDVVDGWFMQTSTLCYRNGLIGEFPEWFWHVYSADYAIQLLVAQHGKIKYFEELKAGRQMSDQSFTSLYNTTLADNQLRINELKVMRDHLPNFVIGDRLGKFYFRRAVLHQQQRNYGRALFCWLKAATEDTNIARMLSQKVLSRVVPGRGKVR